MPNKIDSETSQFNLLLMPRLSRRLARNRYSNNCTTSGRVIGLR